MTMTEKIGEMITIIQSANIEAGNADRGNKAAGKRLRAYIASLLPIIKDIKKQSLGKEE